jgi:hypothetical protein
VVRIVSEAVLVVVHQRLDLFPGAAVLLAVLLGAELIGFVQARREVLEDEGQR